ncbi:MAG: hypothetical protein COS94_09575 [Candidatus Hydrogenedentes bacterium CG07_land_8_20_14_0_80_42_17]|nr:MAG: hypothetical protein AUJ18_05165 [Candidatus Hydrogenedentes bacterium CG1_02_42_14]PIU46663.1 MAG: hypothetical protein COS94_09575 [Candidatus Hydrogenedentes bacterium CG07_land_8_20_14_0_80_42_17]
MNFKQSFKLFSLLAVLSISLLFVSNAYAQSNRNPQAKAPKESAEASRLSDAISTLFGVLSKSPRGDTLSSKVEELYSKGISAERAGKFRDAFRLYQDALNLRYEDPRIHLGIARIIETENPALAIYHYQSAFRYAIEALADKEPAIELLRRFLVGRYLQYALPVDINNPDVSVNLLELAVSMAPEDARIHAHLATAYYFSRNFERSIQESNNAIALGIDDGVIYGNIAAAFAQLNRAAEAESFLVMALNKDEQDINEVLTTIRNAEKSDTMVTLGKLLGKDKLDKLMRESAKGLLEEGVKKWRAGDTVAGLKSVEKAVEKYPEHSYALILLGDFKRQLGDTQSAKAAYKKALERNSKNQLALPRLGDITFADKDFVAAANYYKQAMRLMSGRVEKIDILDRTAVALAQQGKHDEALDLLDQWLKSNSDAPEYFEISVRRAGILSDASRQKDAENVLRGLIERDKINPAGYIVLQTFFKERGDERSANKVINDGIVRLQTVRDQDPLEPQFYRSLARLYRVLGNERSARQELLKGGLRTVEKRFFSNELFASDAETEAFEVLKSWIVSEPKNAEAVLSYGWVAAKLNRELPQAMARVSEIEELYGDANLDPIRRTRGYLHFAMKNYEKAIEDFKAILVSDNVAQAGFFHRLWGASAEALNRRAEALEQYQRAVALDHDGNTDLLPRISELEGIH